MSGRRGERGTALVTGASAGIGLHLAGELAAAGYDLVLVARRSDALEDVAERCRREHGVRATAHPSDLLEPGAPARLVAGLEAEGTAVDLLVNDAGVLDSGRFAEIPVEHHERLVALNVGVLTSLTRRLLPGMLARGRGRILNVASTAAFQPVPSLAVYAASKAFVLSLSESLSEELKGTGVSVTALCPGFTRTHMLEDVEEARLVPGFLVSDPGDVARQGLEACLAGRAIAIPGVPNRLAASLVQLYPRWLVRGVLGMVGRRAGG